jgi:hypothetical protein
VRQRKKSKAEAKWELPDSADWGKTFPCPHHPNRIRVSLKMCQARTRQPDVYLNTCRKCLRWKYFCNYKPKPKPKKERNDAD